MLKRLFRDLQRQKGWIISMILIISFSSGLYSSMRSMEYSGNQTLDHVYHELHSPDILASTEPMRDMSPWLQNVSGVTNVSSAFSTECYTFMKGERVRGQINGIEVDHHRVNDYQILKGNDIRENNDIVVEHHFAEEHDLTPREKITLHLRGNPRTFTVSGICFSPRYLYLISNEGVEEDYGVFYVPKGTISSNVNRYYIKAADASIDDTISNVRSFFERKGTRAVIKKRNEVVAYSAVREDIQGIDTLARTFTLLLGVVVAFCIYVFLSRLVKRRKKEIGSLRAMGFSKWYIFRYYLLFSIFIGTIGVLISIPLSYGILALITHYWANTMLGIPAQFLVYSLKMRFVAQASMFTGIASFIGAFFPAYRAASLTPVEATKSYQTSGTGARVMDKSSLSPTWKLTFREILGHKARSVSTVVAVALILSLSLSMGITLRSYGHANDQRFSENIKWDIQASFHSSKKASIIRGLSNLSGVEKVEPYMDCGAKISFKGTSKAIQLHMMSKSTNMHTFSLSKGEVTKGGVLLSGDVAHNLGVSVNEEVTVRTTHGIFHRAVSGILQELSASEVYLFKRFGNATGALLQVEHGKMEVVEDALQHVSYVESWVRKEELHAAWSNLLEKYQATAVMLDALMVALVIMVVGAFAFISMREREWNFMVLKTMGFSRWQILRNILLESIILAFLGCLISIPVSMQLAKVFNASWKSLMTPPPVILPPFLVLVRILIVLGIDLGTVSITANTFLSGNLAKKLKNAFEFA